MERRMKDSKGLLACYGRWILELDLVGHVEILQSLSATRTCTLLSHTLASLTGHQDKHLTSEGNPCIEQNPGLACNLLMYSPLLPLLWHFPGLHDGWAAV